MRRLTNLDILFVHGGMDEISFFETTTLGCSVVGSLVGGYAASQIEFASAWQFAALPFFTVAGIGLGGLLGFMVGITLSVSHYCLYCIEEVNS